MCNDYLTFLSLCFSFPAVPPSLHSVHTVPNFTEGSRQCRTSLLSFFQSLPYTISYPSSLRAESIWWIPQQSYQAPFYNSESLLFSYSCAFNVSFHDSVLTGKLLLLILLSPPTDCLPPRASSQRTLLTYSSHSVHPPDGKFKYICIISSFLLPNSGDESILFYILSRTLPFP